jgi:hypothetical protein
MNVLDVIKNCISNPYFIKNYDVEEFCFNNTIDTHSITNDSAFTGYSTLVKTDTLSNTPLIDQKLFRVNMRVWNGLRKLIVAMVTKGNCVVCREFGYFFPRGGKVAYSPTMEIMDQCLLLENTYNINPRNRNVIFNITIDQTIKSICHTHCHL